MTKRLFPLVALFLLSCNGNKNSSSSPNATTPAIEYSYVNAYPHDTTAFTEGLLFHDGVLYESTGATKNLPQTKSLFGVVDLKTGRIDTKVALDRAKYFGEGIAFLNGKVFQLTYDTKVGFIYSATNFKKIGEFILPSEEGWGLTTDGTSLIMSDGTNILTYLNPTTLKIVKAVSVFENGAVRDRLNELEYINGFIYANIWLTNTVVKINPADGKVVGALDFTSLADVARNTFSGSLEMNGIAYDPSTEKILITGKLWPQIYEVKFSH